MLYVCRKNVHVRMVSEVPVSFIPQLLPPTFADHILRSFMQEANKYQKKRWSSLKFVKRRTTVQAHCKTLYYIHPQIDRKVDPHSKCGNHFYSGSDMY